MRPYRHSIVYILAVSAVINSFVSCGIRSERPDSSLTGDMLDSSIEAVAPSEFVKDDLGGREFTFLIYNDDAVDYNDSYIWNEAIDGGALSEAVMNRNRSAEEQFNIKISADKVSSPKSEAVNRMKAGQCDFDVIYEWGTRSSSMAFDGMLYDFQELEGADLSKSYWVPSVRDDLTVGGKMYIATNYITMNSIGWADFIFFNKTMYEALGFTESLYDLVDDRLWTFDKYVEIALSASADLDGDGIMTSEDRYGIWGDINGCLTSMAQYAGISNTLKLENGDYSLNMYNEAAINIYTKYSHRLNSGDTFIGYEEIWDEGIDLSGFASKYKGARFVGFGEGHVMFLKGSMDMTREFVDMQDDYGVLPNPLYSSSQEKYYHTVDSNAPMFSIPAQSKNLDVTGIILDYMAYKSEEYLLPAFYDTTIKSKRMPDVGDYKMLDIVKSSIRYEWTELYGLEVTNSIMKKMMTSGSFKSVFKRLSSKAKAEINIFVATLETLE